jgi:hypothetical protein
MNRQRIPAQPDAAVKNFMRPCGAEKILTRAETFRKQNSGCDPNAGMIRTHVLAAVITARRNLFARAQFRLFRF